MIARSERVIRFIENLTNTAGPAAGMPFTLRDWQKAIIRSIYDPQTEESLRVVRTALLTLPRKQGKTELAAALALYHLLADGEINGQVYSAAADKHQASIVFNAAAAIARRPRAERHGEHRREREADRPLRQRQFLPGPIERRALKTWLQRLGADL